MPGLHHLLDELISSLHIDLWHDAPPDLSFWSTSNITLLSISPGAISQSVNLGSHALELIRELEKKMSLPDHSLQSMRTHSVKREPTDQHFN